VTALQPTLMSVASLARQISAIMRPLRRFAAECRQRNGRSLDEASSQLTLAGQLREDTLSVGGGGQEKCALSQPI